MCSDLQSFWRVKSAFDQARTMRQRHLPMLMPVDALPRRALIGTRLSNRDWQRGRGGLFTGAHSLAEARRFGRVPAPAPHQHVVWSAQHRLPEMF